jgi:hypothetical protein
MSSVDISLGIEYLEVTADDLCRPVAFDRLGTRVPAAHDALGIERDDRVVPYPFDEQPVSRLGGATRGEVARDFSEASMLAVFAKLSEDDARPEAASILPQPSSSKRPSLRALWISRAGFPAATSFSGQNFEQFWPMDLVGLVACHALRPRVPGQHGTLGVQHEDAIVPNAVDQKAEVHLPLIRFRMTERVGAIARELTG